MKRSLIREMNRLQDKADMLANYSRYLSLQDQNRLDSLEDRHNETPKQSFKFIFQEV